MGWITIRLNAELAIKIPLGQKAQCYTIFAGKVSPELDVDLTSRPHLKARMGKVKQDI